MNNIKYLFWYFLNFFKENSNFSFLRFFPVFLITVNIVYYLFFSRSLLQNLFFYISCFNIFFSLIYICNFIFFSYINFTSKSRIFFLFSYLLFLSGVFLFSQWLFETWHDQWWYLGYAWRIAYSQQIDIFDDSVVSLFQYIYRDGKIDLAFPNVKFWPFFLSTFYNIASFKWFSLAILFLHTVWVFYIIFISQTFFTPSRNRISIFLGCYLLSYYCTYYTRSWFIENILFLQLWGIIYFFLVFIKTSQKQDLFFCFLLTVSIFFTRPESIIYFASFFLALSWYFFRKKLFTVKLIIMVALWGVFSAFVIDLFLFKWFLSDGIKNISSYWTYNYAYEGKFSVLGVILTYTLTMQLMSLCFFGFLSFKRVFSNKYVIYMVILMLPQVMFFLFPNIQLVMPWAYRRFWPGIFVFWLFLFFMFSHRGIFKNKLTQILIIFLLIFSWGKIYGLFSNENIINQIENMKSFLDRDERQNFWIVAIDNSWAYASILSDFLATVWLLTGRHLKNLQYSIIILQIKSTYI